MTIAFLDLLIIGHNSELPCAFVSKRVLLQNLLYENEFDLHENEPLSGTYLHINGFAQRLVLTQTKANSEIALSTAVNKN